MGHTLEVSTLVRVGGEEHERSLEGQLLQNSGNSKSSQQGFDTRPEVETVCQGRLLGQGEASRLTLKLDRPQ